MNTILKFYNLIYPAASDASVSWQIAYANECSKLRLRLRLLITRLQNRVALIWPRNRESKSMSLRVYESMNRRGGTRRACARSLSSRARLGSRIRQADHLRSALGKR